MKKIKLLSLLTTIILLSSCQDFRIRDNRKETLTTVEILNLAEKDTILYKVILNNNCLYAINTNNNLVEFKAANSSDIIFVLFCIIFALFMMLLFKSL
jgi:hypothetical protein